MTERRLPMFPLESVLVPHAPLPLHVFEPRYRALVEHVLAHEPHEFGVTLIERGSEVGGGDVRTRVGTIASVVQATKAPDGRYGVLAVGTSRIDVAEWLPDDPYPVALVVERDEDALGHDDVDGRVAQVEAAVRSALAMKAEVGDPAPAATVELDESPDVRAWQLVAIAPIAVIDRHALLAIDDTAERLGRLATLVREEADVLAHRIRGL